MLRPDCVVAYVPDPVRPSIKSRVSWEATKRVMIEEIPCHISALRLHGTRNADPHMRRVNRRALLFDSLEAERAT